MHIFERIYTLKLRQWLPSIGASYADPHVRRGADPASDAFVHLFEWPQNRQWWAVGPGVWEHDGTSYPRHSMYGMVPDIE